MPRTTLPLLLSSLLLLPAAVQAQDPDPRELFERGYFQEHALKQLDQAIETYQRVAALAGDGDRELAGRALVRVAACEQARGRDVEARQVLEQVLERFGDLPAVKQAAEQLLGQHKGPRRTLRLYDVEELLTSIPDHPAPSVNLVPDRGHLPGGGGAGGALSFDDAEVPEGRALDPDQLLELVTRNVAEDSWANERNSAQIEGGRLIVTQTAEVHAQLTSYLERLRALRGRVITLEVSLALLEPGLARELARAPGPLPADKLNDLERRLRGGQPGARLLGRQRLTAWDRQTVHAAALEERRYVQQDVNQTGVVPVLTPAVLEGHEGLLVELRPALVAEGHLLLELAAAWSQWSFRQLKVEAGDLSLPPERRAGDVVMLPRADLFLLRAAQLVRAGATHLAGVVRAPRFASEALPDPYAAVLVRAEVSRLDTGKADAPGSSEPRTLRIHDVSLLTSTPRPADFLGRSFLDDEDGDDRRALSPDTLLELIQRNVAPETWTSDLNSLEVMSDGALLVMNTPEVQAQVDAFLATLRRARGRALDVELARVSISAEELARLIEAGRAAGPGAYVVPPGAVEALEKDPARLLGWADVTVWEGHTARVRESGHLGYLADHERSSGGLGAGAMAVVSQPVARVVGEGATLDVQARLLPDGKHAAIDLSLHLGHVAGLDEVPTSTGPIELPRRRTRDHRCAVSFPLDQVLVVTAGIGDPADPLRGAVLVRVRAENLLGGE